MQAIERLPSTVHGPLRSSVLLFDLPRIVEELVFFSLESGATKVNISVGVERCYLKVEDDGHGITRDELVILGEHERTATVNHGIIETPNCHEICDDECSIGTSNSKGEALGSLSDSSVVEVRTKAVGRPNSYCKIMKGSKCSYLGIDDMRDVHGTTVVVRDLFYNQPVRRKCMQSSPRNVVHSIKKCIIQIALAYPHVSFKLTDTESEDELLCTISSSSPLPLISDGFGKEVRDCLQEISYADREWVLSGYISGPHKSSSIKAFQYLYINSRFVNKGPIHNLINSLAASIQHCISDNDTPEIHKRKKQKVTQYPAFLLKLSCPNSSYDITFEPSKTKVEFKEWHRVMSFFEQAITNFWKHLVPREVEEIIVTSEDFLSKENEESCLFPEKNSSRWNSNPVFCQSFSQVETDRDMFSDQIHEKPLLDIDAYFHISSHNSRINCSIEDNVISSSVGGNYHLFDITSPISSREPTTSTPCVNQGAEGEDIDWVCMVDDFQKVPTERVMGSDLTFKFCAEVKRSLNDLCGSAAEVCPFPSNYESNGAFDAAERRFGSRLSPKQNIGYLLFNENPIVSDEVCQVLSCSTYEEIDKETTKYTLGSCATRRKCNTGTESLELDLDESLLSEDKDPLMHENWKSETMDYSIKKISDKFYDPVPGKSPDIESMSGKASPGAGDISNWKSFNWECESLDKDEDVLDCKWNRSGVDSLKYQKVVLDSSSMTVREKSHFLISGGMLPEPNWMCQKPKCEGRTLTEFSLEKKADNSQPKTPCDRDSDAGVSAEHSSTGLNRCLQAFNNPTCTLRRSHSAPPHYRGKKKFFSLKVPLDETCVASQNCAFQRGLPGIKGSKCDFLNKEASRPLLESSSSLSSEMKTREPSDQSNYTCEKIPYGSDELEYPSLLTSKWRPDVLPLAISEALADSRACFGDDILSISSEVLLGYNSSLVPEFINRDCLKDARVLFQLDKKFIPVIASGQLVIIDQHAADERIRLEDLRRKVMSGEGCEVSYLEAGENLVLPEMGFQIFQKHATLIEKWGWLANNSHQSSNSFSKNITHLKKHSSLTLTAVPSILGIDLSSRDLVEYIEQLVETDGSSTLPPAVLRILNFKACRGAIMFGDSLLPSECSLMIEELKETSLCFQCAHGRPTAVPLVNIVALHEQLARLGAQNRQPGKWQCLSRHNLSIERAQMQVNLAKGLVNRTGNER